MSETPAVYKAENGALMEAVLVGGDLAKLSADQRVTYYKMVCDSVGLNPFTKPFDYITLNGKLVLYANRNCAEQLRDNKKVSVTIPAREVLSDGTIYVVTARATLPDGRVDESTGVVSIQGLKGDALANSMMKAETKAKRRVSLSICSLGMLDETEVTTVPGARVVRVDPATGVIESPRPELVTDGEVVGSETTTTPTDALASNPDGDPPIPQAPEPKPARRQAGPDPKLATDDMTVFWAWANANGVAKQSADTYLRAEQMNARKALAAMQAVYGQKVEA